MSDVPLCQHFIRRFLAGELTAEEKRRWGEFCMREEMIRKLGTQHENSPDEQEKWLKYFTLGWYIYEILGIEGN